MVKLSVLFLSSFVIALSGALMPGPLLTATIGESARWGLRAGPLLILGHGLLEVALLVALLFGLAPLLRRDAVFAALALVGAAILLRISVGMLRSPSLEDPTGSVTQSGSLVLNGAFLSLANPYWSLWWATIGLGYVLYSKQFGPAGIAAFFVGHISADLAWYTAVAVAIAKGRRFFSDRSYRWLIQACAFLLFLFAGIFFVMGLQKAGLLR